ncbi:MAG: hypothetical protein AAF628_25345 [Planctomycetota bacterium]
MTAFLEANGSVIPETTGMPGGDLGMGGEAELRVWVIEDSPAGSTVAVGNLSAIRWQDSVSNQQHCFNCIGLTSLSPNIDYRVELRARADAAFSYTVAARHGLAVFAHPSPKIDSSELTSDWDFPFAGSPNITTSHCSMTGAANPCSCLPPGPTEPPHEPALQTYYPQVPSWPVTTVDSQWVGSRAVALASGTLLESGGTGDAMLGLEMYSIPPDRVFGQYASLGGVHHSSYSVTDLYDGAERRAPVYVHGITRALPLNTFFPLPVRLVATEFPLCPNNVDYSVESSTTLISISALNLAGSAWHQEPVVVGGGRAAESAPVGCTTCNPSAGCVQVPGCVGPVIAWESFCVGTSALSNQCNVPLSTAVKVAEGSVQTPGGQFGYDGRAFFSAKVRVVGDFDNRAALRVRLWIELDGPGYDSEVVGSEGVQGIGIREEISECVASTTAGHDSHVGQRTLSASFFATGLGALDLSSDYTVTVWAQVDRASPGNCQVKSMSIYNDNPIIIWFG